MDLYVLSLRDRISSPAYSCVVEFEDVFIKSTGASLVTPKTIHELKFNRDLKAVGTGRALFVVGISISTIVSGLEFALKYLDDFDGIYAYVFDSILNDFEINKSKLRKTLSRYYRIIKKIDRIFVPMTLAVKEFEECFSVPVSFVPLASNVLDYGGFFEKKFIDVNGYGRQDIKCSNSLSETFNDYGSDKVYYHTDHMSICNLNDFYAHRRFFWKMLRGSKIALAFDPVFANNDSRFRFSFVGQRWFESAAAGCVIVGKRPTCPEMAELFSWENATIEIPDNENPVFFIENLLGQHNELSLIGEKNYINSLKGNDWRHRLCDIFSLINVEIMPSLESDLELLKSKILRTESLIKIGG